jgi:glycosyltransferase involved in cell wall biosynthesis
VMLLRDNAAYQKMGRQAAQAATKKFNRGKIIRQYESLYQS